MKSYLGTHARFVHDLWNVRVLMVASWWSTQQRSKPFHRRTITNLKTRLPRGKPKDKENNKHKKCPSSSRSPELCIKCTVDNYTCVTLNRDSFSLFLSCSRLMPQIYHLSHSQLTRLAAGVVSFHRCRTSAINSYVLSKYHAHISMKRMKTGSVHTLV